MDILKGLLVFIGVLLFIAAIIWGLIQDFGVNPVICIIVFLIIVFAYDRKYNKIGKVSK